jgi:DNA-directed RNA polymerase subunit RPC12/RpoP
MAIQVPEPDFGEVKCPDCETIMKPVTLTKEQDQTTKLLECPKCRRRVEQPAR